MLPKNSAEIVNGGIYRQAVRCGKLHCRCASGDPHSGYFYFIRRIDGRQRKTYIPKAQVAEFEKLLLAARRARCKEKQHTMSVYRLLSRARALLRERDRDIKSLADEIRAIEQNNA